MRRALVVLGLLAFTGAATVLAGNGVQTRRMGIGRTSTHLTVSFRFGDLFGTKTVRRAVDRGLKTTILATVRAYRDGNPDASVGGTARTCEIYRDVWEEDYRATVLNRDTGTRRFRVRTYEQVVRLCADVRSVPVARLHSFRSGRTYRIGARLEVNPLSADAVRRIQRWLRNPEPTGGGEGSGIFGSVASLFVNPRIGQAERTLLLRSQRFEAP